MTLNGQLCADVQLRAVRTYSLAEIPKAYSGKGDREGISSSAVDYRVWERFKLPHGLRGGAAAENEFWTLVHFELEEHILLRSNLISF